MNMSLPIIIAIAGAIFLAIIVLAMLAKLYIRSTKEMSFVRTGWGGQKVISDGGALVLPILQETTPVNMKTLRLLVERRNEEALITLDRMRADVTAEFYVRVKKDQDAIAQAAQSFGNKTLNPEALKDLLQGKFVDALRSVASGMDMQTLHEKRAEFVQSVQTTVAEDLSKNGLELESVSLTGFDQTSIEYFNENNSFDAQGLANVAKITEAKREERNRIEQDTRIAIETKNLDSEQKSLEIKKDEEFARLNQERQIAIQKAEQDALIKQQEAVRRQEAEEAEIIAQQKVKEAEIEAEKEIKTQDILKERDIEQANINRQKEIETTDILKKKAVEISEQDAAIAVANKSEAKSQAEAEAAKARAQMVSEEENVKTVQQTAEANRAKEVEVIKAREEAEKEAISITIAAEADKKAAEDKAEALLTEARAESEAIKIKADADQKRFEIEAYGEKAINEAKNMLSESIISFELKKIIAEVSPQIIEASVKPMENIDSIKILSAQGGLFSGGGVGEPGTTSNGSSNLPDQLVDALMKHRLQVPMIDELLGQLGIEPTSLKGLTASLEDSAQEEAS